MKCKHCKETISCPELKPWFIVRLSSGQTLITKTSKQQHYDSNEVPEICYVLCKNCNHMNDRQAVEDDFKNVTIKPAVNVAKNQILFLVCAVSFFVVVLFFRRFDFF